MPGTVVTEMARPNDSMLRTRRLKRVEYDRLIEAAVFLPSDKVELIDGLLVAREPQRSLHATGIMLANEALRAGFGAGWVVRVQLPIALDEDSEPEPDLVVVRGTVRDFTRSHPNAVALIVEVADSSLHFDRTDKASLYARAGVADYWIVNLLDAVVEVHRDPRPTPAAAYGWHYGSIRVATPGETVTPLARPGQSLRVADLLP
jgi:Uma2 family endonuclease